MACVARERCILLNGVVWNMSSNPTTSYNVLYVVLPLSESIDRWSAVSHARLFYQIMPSRGIAVRFGATKGNDRGQQCRKHTEAANQIR